MMWVKETLPPRARFRWLLMTIRLSISSLAGTARTLVAVGTSREASMLVTTRAAGPFRTAVVVAAAPPAGAGAAVVAASRGTWTGAGAAGAAAAPGPRAGAAGCAAGAGAGAGTVAVAAGAAAAGAWGGREAADVSEVTVTSGLSTFATGARACAAAELSVGW